MNEANTLTSSSEFNNGNLLFLIMLSEKFVFVNDLKREEYK